MSDIEEKEKDNEKIKNNEVPEDQIPKESNEEINQEEKEKKNEEEHPENKEEKKEQEEKNDEKKEEEEKEEKQEELKEENKKIEEKETTIEEEKNDETAPNPKTEEKELNAEEEGKKEIYDAIKELKPEEASANVKSKLILLSNVHSEYLKIKEDQYGVEYDTLRDIYDKKDQEIYDKIESIVTTKEKEKIEITQEEKEKYGITDDETEIKEIEDYWEKVIINSRYFAITDKDKLILKYLNKIKMEKFPANKKNNINYFRVDFYFKVNEFFSNQILSKTYIYNKDATLKKAEGTKIDWKSPDKNTTIEKVRKKTRKGKRFFNEEKEKFVDSFFAIFEQVDDMNILTDEVSFFKDDFFANQLEYYLDIVSKTKNGDYDDGEDYDDGYYDNNNNDNYYDNNNKGKKGDKYGGNGGKKEDCKNQ